MSVPTLPRLNGPRARGFTCKPLRYEAYASSLSHARSIAQQPARPSAYTVPGRARDFHPHSLKRARSSPTPASCPTQPSLPITPEFYHDSHAHVQKRPRMWHSSAAPTYAAVDIFHFPRSKSRQCRHFSRAPRHSARKEPNMPHSSPFLYKSLDQLASNNIHPRSLSSTRRFQQCSAQATLLMRGIQYGPPKSIPNARARYPIPRASPPRQKSRPTNVERLSIKPCEVSTGLGFNHPKPSIKNVLGARFTQRPLRSRASQPWEQQPSSWADAAREPGWSRQPQPQSPGREQQPSWTG